MHRRDAEAPRENEITKLIIGFAIEVHRALGPTLKRMVNRFSHPSASLRLCGKDVV
jgi:hypothetical protein